MGLQNIKGITIQIGGDTTNLVSALSKVDSAIKNTQSNLREINNALKFDPTNTNLLADKQRELGNRVDEAKERLEKEKQAYEELQNKVNNTPLDLDHAPEIQKDTEQLEKLKTQIDLDTTALKEAEKASRDFGSVLKQQCEAVGAKLKEVGGKISEIGQNMTTKVTVPIAAGFTAAIKTTSDFESQMSKVQAISGSNAEQMDALKEKARDMGATTKFSASEAGEAMEYMAMAGWKTEDMLNGVSGIMHLAAASGEELGTTSDIVTDALTAFGMSADESGRFADILASAASNANTNVSMMGESFKYAAPVAGALGYSAEDVAVALGLMANSGIKADMAGTSLRNMFNRMAKPTKESQAAMDRLGISLQDDEGKMYSFREIMDQLRSSMGDINIDLDEYNQQLDLLDQQLEDGTLTQSKYDAALEELNKQCFGAEGAEKARAAAMLGGTRAMSGLLAIANASEADYEKLTSAIDNSSQAFAKLADGSIVPLNEALTSGQEIIEQYNGSAEAMAAQMEDNLGGDITKLKSALQELAISMGELLIPLCRQITDVIQGIVDYLNGLDDSTKETILQIAAVVAAIGPVLLVGGKIITGIGSVITAVGAIHGAIAAIIPVVSAAAAFITGTVIPAIAAIGAPILLIPAAIAAVIAAIVLCVKHWDEIKAKAEEVTKKMKEAWEDFTGKVSEKWNELKEKVSGAMDNIKSAVTDKFNEVKTNATNKVNELKSNATNAFNNLKSTLTSTMANIASTVTNKFNEAKTNAVNKVNELKSNAVNKFNELRNNASSVFDNMRSAISGTIGNIKDTIVSGFQNAVSYITSLPSQAIGWGRDIINGIVDGIYNAFHNLVSAVSDIANTIADYIHFSEPDKGPLKNFHTFMPDMMGQLAEGIRKGIPEIAGAMDTMARTMTPTMAAGTTNNTSNAFSINVYGAQGQSEEALARMVEERMKNRMARQGAAWGGT